MKVEPEAELAAAAAAAAAAVEAAAEAEMAALHWSQKLCRRNKRWQR